MAMSSGKISDLDPVTTLSGEVWFEIITRHSTAVGFTNKRVSKTQLIEQLSTAGADGKTAYEVAVEFGFEGTPEEWLESLKGRSAFDIAVENGYGGTYNQWVLALQAIYEIATEDAGKFLTNDGVVSRWMFLTPADVGLDGIQEDVGSRLRAEDFQERFNTAFFMALEMLGFTYNENTQRWGVDQGQMAE